MIRILQVYPQLNNAGTEMVIMNLYKNIDRNKIQFDFCVQKSGELDETVKNMGGKIYYIDKSSKYSEDVFNFFKQHPEYEIVHTHTHKEMGLVLQQAARAGVKYRIAHSHNSRSDLPKVIKLYKMFTGRDIEKYATHFFACSKEAAKWLFPRKYNECVVWNNGIDMQRFYFDINVRESVRDKLNIPQDAKVICHVGRFAEQKNHKRIITLLNKMCSDNPNTYAILVGIGPLLDEIKNKSESDRIIFLGNRTDVPDLMCASDMFLFPSLYEGLGIVAVEAQSSGIPCLASSGVPKAADIGIGLFESLSLDDSDDAWLNRIEFLLEKSTISKREELSEKASNTNYNIIKVAAEAQNFYLTLG